MTLRANPISPGSGNDVDDCYSRLLSPRMPFADRQGHMCEVGLRATVESLHRREAIQREAKKGKTR